MVLQLIVYAVISYFAATIVHEFGHILVGLMNGWKLFLMALNFQQIYN